MVPWKQLQRARLVSWLGNSIGIGVFVLMISVSAVTKRDPSPLWFLPNGVLFMLLGGAQMALRDAFAELHAERRDRFSGIYQAFMFAPSSATVLLQGVAMVLLGCAFIVVAVQSRWA